MTRHPGFLLTVALLLPVSAVAQGRLEADVIETRTLVVAGVEHPIRVLRDGRATYLNLEDVATAVGGAWGRDPLSRDPLFTVGDDRVLFSTRDRRIAVNGRRRRLSRPVKTRSGGVWVPPDFVEAHLPALIDAPVRFLDTAPRSASPLDAATLPDTVPSPSSPPDDAALPGDSLLDRQGSPAGLRSIILDPGHGGEEEGARGPTGLLEKDVVLEVARRLRIHLQRRGYDVHLTRNRDVNMPLEERTAVANNRRADLFISLHANASSGRRARGAETYYLSLDRAEQARHQSEPAGAYVSQRDRDDPLKMILWDMAQSAWLAESGRLAEIIQADFNRVLDIPDRGIKQAPFRILVGATMPAVLVEIGFISNAEEEERLRDPDFLNLIVESLVRSIDAYRGERRLRTRGRSTGWPGGGPVRNRR